MAVFKLDKGNRLLPVTVCSIWRVQRKIIYKWYSWVRKISGEKLIIISLLLSIYFLTHEAFWQLLEFLYKGSIGVGKSWGKRWLGRLALKLCLHSKQHCFYLNCFFIQQKNNNVFPKAFLFTSYKFLFINCFSWWEVASRTLIEIGGGGAQVEKLAPPHPTRTPATIFFGHTDEVASFTQAVGDKARRERTRPQGVSLATAVRTKVAHLPLQLWPLQNPARNNSGSMLGYALCSLLGCVQRDLLHFNCHSHTSRKVGIMVLILKRRKLSSEHLSVLFMLESEGVSFKLQSAGSKGRPLNSPRLLSLFCWSNRFAVAEYQAVGRQTRISNLYDFVNWKLNSRFCS